MGLLGIVTAIDVRLRPDTGFEMRLSTRSFTGSAWNAPTMTAWVRDTMEGATGGHYYYDVYSGNITALIMANGATDAFNASSTLPHYAEQKALNPTLAVTGSIVAPALAKAVVAYAHESGAALLAYGTASSAIHMRHVAQWWQANAVNPRDGYFFPSNALTYCGVIQTFVSCPGDCVSDGKIFAALDVTRVVLQGFIATPNANWYPNLVRV